MVIPFAHTLEVRNRALTLLRDGVRNAEVSQALGVPVGTVGYWKHLDRRRSGELPGAHRSICPRCDPDALPLNRRAYSYLLGLYLGDGCLCGGAAMREKGVYALVIACADEWPVRGLIHSDGCRVLNSAVRTKNGRTTRYFYSRHHFTNESVHIRDLFTGTLDRLGIEWRNNRRNCVSIARRESVRRLDAFVGPKY